MNETLQTFRFGVPYHMGLRPKPPAATSGDPFAPRRCRRAALCAAWGRPR